MSFKGKVAVITGGSRGIGRAVALKLAQGGADIFFNYSGREDAAKETMERLKELGVKAETMKADVSKEEDVTALFKKIMEDFGRVDILINNAGITRDNLLMRMKDREWDDVININLKGTYLCTKAVSRIMMKQRSGRIINIASVVGLLGNVGQANYVASKAGVIGLTKTTALELATRGITVNAVAPGFIHTEMTEDLGGELKEMMIKQIPLARRGEPEDVANAVCFLASDEASYITGQTLSVDGGMKR